MTDAPVRRPDLPPGPGHNHPPEPLDPIDMLDLRLARTYRELVVRFADLEIGCARVPNPIDNDDDAAAATDFIAQCQSHIKTTETAHKTEKAYFLKASRIVDGFFKRRCTKLTDALIPVIGHLKAYRDQIAAREAKRCEEARRLAEAEALQAATEEAQYRATADRLAREARTPSDRRLAAEQLHLADAAAARAMAAQQAALAKPEPTHIRGDYGSTAYVRKSWAFEVIALDDVPRDYMSLDVEVVKEAINKDSVREIPGLRIYQAETLQVRGAA